MKRKAKDVKKTEDRVFVLYYIRVVASFIHSYIIAS
jgi:hypothetical protein